MSDYITPSLKRALRGKTLKPITDDYTMKEVNSMLTALLGRPGVSAGKAQRSLDSQIASGNSTSAYGAAQMDVQSSGMQLGQGAATGVAAGIGLIRDLIGMAYNRKTDSIAYNRQNDFYNNHLSMPAKVEEYQDAGLNPMGLAGAGAGATSAPSVQGTGAPELNGLTSILGDLLSYKAQMARIEVDKQRVSIEERRLPSLIEQAMANAENRRKQVEWYDTAISKMNAEITQIDANVGKLFAETEKIDAETFLTRIYGQFAEPQQQAMLLNLYKDLGVKDSQISKNDADAALAWANKNLTDITSQYQGELMSANSAASRGRAVVNYAEAAIKEFEVSYKQMHNGASPPSGIVGAVIGVCSSVANRITGVASNPNYGVLGN